MEEATVAEQDDEVTSGGSSSGERATVYRSRVTGRIVTQAERIAAARARIVADEIRGIETEPWIVELSKESA